MPIVGGSGVSVAPRNAGDPSVIEPMPGTPGSGDTLEQVLINGDEANGQIIHGGNAALLLLGGPDGDDSAGVISLLPSGSGIGGAASINGGDSQGGDSIAGGTLLMFGGAGDTGQQGGVAQVSGGGGDSGASSGAALFLGGGSDGTIQGPSAGVTAGNGPSGAAGGDAVIAGGLGDGGAQTGALIGARGGTSTDPGKVQILSDNSAGNAGEIFTADGLGFAVWAPPASAPVRPLEIIVDGGGSDIPTGVTGYLYVPFDGTIVSGVLLGDAVGDVQVDVYLAALIGYPPTVADSIVSSNPLVLSTSDNSIDSILTGWATAVTAGDVIAYNIDSVSGIAKLTICLNIQPA